MFPAWGAVDPPLSAAVELIVVFPALGAANPPLDAAAPTMSGFPARGFPRPILGGGRRWLPGFRNRGRAGGTREAALEPEPTPPSVASVIATAIDIMQDRLNRGRLAGDPPDLLLTPRVRQIAPLDFLGGQTTIEEGYDIVRRMLPALRDLLEGERTS